jgi:hypothetical protein
MDLRLSPLLVSAKAQCVYALKIVTEKGMASEAGYGVVPIEEARTLDGLDLFRGLLEGRYPAPPITKALGFKLIEVDAGRVVFGYTPVLIKVNYVRAMTDRTGPVRAEGKVITVGSRIATSEGRVADAAGKLLAHGTTTCLIFPI